MGSLSDCGLTDDFDKQKAGAGVGNFTLVYIRNEHLESESRNTAGEKMRSNWNTKRSTRKVDGQRAKVVYEGGCETRLIY